MPQRLCCIPVQPVSALREGNGRIDALGPKLPVGTGYVLFPSFPEAAIRAQVSLKLRERCLELLWQ